MSHARHGCLGLPAVFAVLLLTSTAALAQEFPFHGVVNADGVNVYAGASTNYYVVTRLDNGDLVRVHDNLYGWYKIDPPADTFSYIAKEYVQAGVDGRSGVVRGQRVRVRAPSPGGPDNSYRTQLMIDDGFEVRILGDEGGFYRIAPPEGARLFVKAEFVDAATPQQVAAAEQARSQAEAAAAGDRAAQQPAAQPQPQPQPQQAVAEAGSSEAPAERAETAPPQPEAPAAAPAESSDAQAADVPAASEEAQPAIAAAPAEAEAASAEEGPPAEPQVPAHEAVAADAVGSTTPAQAEAAATEPEEEPYIVDTSGIGIDDLPIRPRHDELIELEKRYLVVSKQPVIEQRITPMRMDYERMLSVAQLGERDRALVRARITLLKDRQQLQASLQQIDATRRQLAEAERLRREADAARPREYVAVGRLAPSTLYTGDKLPLLYRLINPIDGVTIGYLQPAEDGPDPRPMLGKLVGVMGQRQFDPALKLNVIQPTALDALAAEQAAALR